MRNSLIAGAVTGQSGAKMMTTVSSGLTRAAGGFLEKEDCHRASQVWSFSVPREQSLKWRIGSGGAGLCQIHLSSTLVPPPALPSPLQTLEHLPSPYTSLPLNWPLFFLWVCLSSTTHWASTPCLGGATWVPATWALRIGSKYIKYLNMCMCGSGRGLKVDRENIKHS